MEPIVVKTKMTYQDYSKYLWFTLFHTGKGIRASALFALIAFAVGIVVILGMFLMIGLNNVPLHLWLLFALLPLVMGLFLLRVPIQAKMTQKTSKFLFETTNIYTISADGVVGETIGQDVSGNATFRFEAYHKVCETADYFYWFISAQQAYILPKRDIAPGQENGLVELLREKLGRKYIVCY